MKKTLVLLGVSALILSAWPVQAADTERDMPPPPHEQRMEHPGKRLAADLGLTEEQKAEAEKLRQAGREKMKPLFKQMDELRDKMDKLREENMKEFENILTKEQKEKFEQIKKDHPRPEHRRKGMHRGNRGGADDMPPPPPHHDKGGFEPLD